MSNGNFSKRRYLTVVTGPMCDPTPSITSGGDIYTRYQYFSKRVRHLKGSNRPEGWFHSLWVGTEQTVEVRWLWTEEHKYFAPEISFRPTQDGIKISRHIGTALSTIGRTYLDGPDELADALLAVTVEYVTDRKEGCWDDYRPLRVPGEPAMMTIARHASTES